MPNYLKAIPFEIHEPAQPDTPAVSDGRIMEAIISKEIQRGPIRTRIDDDAVSLEKAREVCHQLNWQPPVSLNWFYSKSQIDPRKLKEWKLDRLVSFARQSELNARNEGIKEPHGATTFEFEQVEVQPVMHFDALPQQTSETEV